jgi:hypothetical protein
MMDNIKIKRNNTFSLSTHFSPERPDLQKKQSNFTKPQKSFPNPLQAVSSMNHHLAARELTEEFLDSNDKLHLKPLRGLIKTTHLGHPNPHPLNKSPSIPPPTKTFVVEETFLHNSLKYRKILGTLRLEDDLYRSQILTEELSELNNPSNVKSVPIKGWLRFDDIQLELLEESIDIRGKILRRKVDGNLRVNCPSKFGLPEDFYRIVEEIGGRRKRIGGELKVGIIGGGIGLMELVKDRGGEVTSKRKVNGVVRVYVNDGLKLMELFGEVNLEENAM